MTCKKITYRNFRNIENATIEPSPDVTVLNGDNGQGKTNMLEGIYIFARGKSFRTSHEEELINFDSSTAEIRLLYENFGVENELSITLLRQGKKRIFRKNGVPVGKNSEIIGLFNAVLFCPQQMSVINGGPGERRQFLNIALSQTDPVYLQSLQKYNKILEQRNALIKAYLFGNRKSGFDELKDALTMQLVKEWALIAEKRYAYSKQINERANGIIKDITKDRETLDISYPEPKTEDEYIRLFEESAERELKYGTTLCGAHREDLFINLGENPAKDFASQGQQRTILLAMKLSEGEIIKQETGHYPVFLLDDILSELDGIRREYLLNSLSEKQVIITSCDHVKTSGKLYRIKNGCVSS